MEDQLPLWNGKESSGESQWIEELKEVSASAETIDERIPNRSHKPIFELIRLRGSFHLESCLVTLKNGLITF
jgi:hypothetical protein